MIEEAKIKVSLNKNPAKSYGAMTVITSFLEPLEALRLQQLDRKTYRVMLPKLFILFPIPTERVYFLDGSATLEELTLCRSKRAFLETYSLPNLTWSGSADEEGGEPSCFVNVKNDFYLFYHGVYAHKFQKLTLWPKVAHQDLSVHNELPECHFAAVNY